MKVLVIDGHPDSESFVTALADAYVKSALGRGDEVVRLNVRDLDFDPILRHGYRKIQPLEPDLVSAQEHVTWCQHLALFYPMWWGQMPAELKGFVDRTFLPGFAFKYHEDDPMWDRLLEGRSARLVITSDAPWFFNWLVYLNAPIRVTRQMFLRFCGFKPVKVTAVGQVKNLSDQQRADWLAKIGQAA